MTGASIFKGYLQHKTINFQNVSSEAQIKNIFISWSVPKTDTHFVTFLVGVKEILVIFFLPIITLIEQDSG